MRILVADKSNTTRKTIEIFLQNEGHEVFMAEDGFETLAKVHDHQPNLVFCDTMIPLIDGYNVCAIIRKNKKLSLTPIVLLTSKFGVFERSKAYLVGGNDCLTKPFTKDQIIQLTRAFQQSLNSLEKK